MALRFFKTIHQVSNNGEVKDMYLATIETGEVVDIDEISEQIEKKMKDCTKTISEDASN